MKDGWDFYPGVFVELHGQPQWESWTRGRRIELVATVHRLGDLFEELVQIAALEQSVAIRRIPVHLYVATGCPFANRVVVDAKVFSRLGGVHVFRQFRHGPSLISLGANFARAVA